MFDLVPRCQVSRCPVPRFQSPHQPTCMPLPAFTPHLSGNDSLFLAATITMY